MYCKAKPIYKKAKGLLNFFLILFYHTLMFIYLFIYNIDWIGARCGVVLLFYKTTQLKSI